MRFKSLSVNFHCFEILFLLDMPKEDDDDRLLWRKICIWNYFVDGRCLIMKCFLSKISNVWLSNLNFCDVITEMFHYNDCLLFIDKNLSKNLFVVICKLDEVGNRNLDIYVWKMGVNRWNNRRKILLIYFDFDSLKIKRSVRKYFVRDEIYLNSTSLKIWMNDEHVVIYTSAPSETWWKSFDRKILQFGNDFFVIFQWLEEEEKFAWRCRFNFKISKRFSGKNRRDEIFSVVQVESVERWIKPSNQSTRIRWRFSSICH